MDCKELIRRVFKAGKARKMTGLKVAQALDTDPSTLYRFQSGSRKNPDSALLQKIIKTFPEIETDVHAYLRGGNA